MSKVNIKWLLGLLGLLAAMLVPSAPVSWAASNDHAAPRDSAAAVATPPHAVSAAKPQPLPPMHHDAMLLGTHHLVVRDAHGKIISEQNVPNMVTTAGKNYLLGAGLAGTPSAITSWYEGMLAEASHQSVSSCSSSTLTVPSSVSTTTGQYVTVYGATTVATTISTGASSTTQTLSGTCPSSATLVSFGPVLAAADTASSHSGWSAVSSSVITNGTWPAWTAGSVSAGSVNNSGSPAVITMASSIATQYLHGLFLTSSSALATSSGTLYSEVEFTGGALAVGSSYTVTDTYTLSLSRLENHFQDFVDWLYGEAA